MAAAVDHLRRLAAGDLESQRRRDADLDTLLDLVKRQTIRDEPFTAEFYRLLFSFIKLAFTWRGKEGQARVEKAEAIFWNTIRFPEFEVSAAKEEVTDVFLQAVLTRTDGTASQEEWPFLRDVFLWAYINFPARRGVIRAGIGRTLRAFSKFSHRSAPVAPLLQVLAPMIRGFSEPMAEVHKALFTEVLLPLHAPNEWQQWDRQTALLGMYHQELVVCLNLFLEKKPQLSVRTIEAVCSYFPPSREANTPKDVLLLYEMARFFKYLRPDDFRQVLPVLMRHMLRLLSSQNAQPIQAVLQFWKDEHFVELARGESPKIIPQLLPALLRGGELFWNLTVNRMTSLVLEKLEQSNPEVFEKAAEEIWGPGGSVPMFEIRDAAAAEAAAKAAAEEEEAAASGNEASHMPNVSSLKFCMAGWQPPNKAGGGGNQSAATTGGKKQPPLTTTGVAPWAFGAGGNKSGPLTGMSQASSSTSTGRPPATVTGVAPWAFGSKPKSGPLAGMMPDSGKKPLNALPENEAQNADKTKLACGIDRVREFMRRLCPEGSSTNPGTSEWESALTAETPTLLPKLKFHEIVFGNNDLGSGAFSVVRYARAIVKGRTQKDWPEFAVKVINTKTIEEQKYEASVNREICVLRMLSHPGIARMVASFRYRDGAYLVLEYAAKGDLHSVLIRQGAFDEETAKFFLGEVVAALIAIHEVGFVYGDLKPENIVITSNNHAKLTDFGACRPITPEARDRTRQSLLKHLRDGDWRAKDEDQPSEIPIAEVSDAEDCRVEGTTLYLPPEVVAGAAPTLASDAWAMGCLTFQLLVGRPPIWVESEQEEELRQRIVSFRPVDSLSMDTLSGEAQAFITHLMEADAAKRLSVTGAAADPFFAGLEVYSLYRRASGPQVSVKTGADVPPAGDARWQKRQYSKIWTTVPQVQDESSIARGGEASSPSVIAETQVERDCPFGDEVSATAALPTLSSNSSKAGAASSAAAATTFSL